MRKSELSVSLYQDHEVLYMLRIFEQMKFRFDREGGDKGGRERERGLPMSHVSRTKFPKN